MIDIDSTAEAIKKEDPVAAFQAFGKLFTGLNHRDYFAARAMQALLSHPDRDYKWSDAAKDAYSMADAMMAEREK